MSIIAKVAAALQQLFGDCATQAAHQSRVIVRQRRFTPLALARTFVLGFLKHPNASAEQLAQTAAQAGAAVTPQAIDQRQTPKLVQFLQELFCRATQIVVGADQALAPLLERFTRVLVLNASTPCRK
jgi:hypothetical protein